MQSKVISPKAYIEELPEERKGPISKLRKIILANLPKGMEETMNYGMLGYVVPHSVYPNGYHCTPELPLPFINLASQKNFIAVHHMGVYASKELLNWFVEEYPNHCNRKLDMGKSCIRFKKMDDIPYQLIGALVAKMSTEEWIQIYESRIKKK